MRRKRDDRNRRIAVVVEKSRDYGRELLRGVVEYAREKKHDWTLCILSSEDCARRQALAGFDGIIARIDDGRSRRRFLQVGVPVVDVFNQKSSPGIIGVDPDNPGIGRLAAEYFLERGYKSFAYCGYRGIRFSQVRARAYAETLRKHGFRSAEFHWSDPKMNEFLFDERNVTPVVSEVFVEWLKRLSTPVAVFCANDFLAYALANAAFKLKRLVPDDIAVLGVDNDELLCSFAPVPLSSINPDARVIGRSAARLLAAAMSDPKALKRARKPYFVRSRGVIERASTDFRPVGPKWMPRVLSFIDRNLDTSVTLKDLSRECGYSRTTVSKVFQKVFGVTPAHYILDRRMKLAEKLMKEGQHLSKEICFMAGFSSAGHFCRAYHAYHKRHVPASGRKQAEG